MKDHNDISNSGNIGNLFMKKALEELWENPTAMILGSAAVMGVLCLIIGGLWALGSFVMSTGKTDYCTITVESQTMTGQMPITTYKLHAHRPWSVDTVISVDIQDFDSAVKRANDYGCVLK